MDYIDREGNIRSEETGQDVFLKHLYNDRGGKLCLGLMIRPFVSKLGGRFLGSPLSRGLIPGFVKKNHIDLSVYEEKEYRSYNDFFIRRIREGERPFDEDPCALLCPCDGKVSASLITPDKRFLIKNREYTVESLLRNSRLAERFAGGYAVIVRLTVDDYHHYMYPAAGYKSPQVRIDGVFHTVNPAANDARPIYAENTREYCLIRTDGFGTLLVMEVGAMMVGKIHNLHPEERDVHRGEEKGYFEFGGSTVILLAQKGKVRIDEDLLLNTERGFETLVKMGEKIGECEPAEGA